MTRRYGVAIALILGLAVLAATSGVCEAAFLQGYSGNTNAKQAGVAPQDLTMNFAVYDRDNTDPYDATTNPDPYGLGANMLGAFVPGTVGPLGAFDQEYLYLYELVNNGTAAAPVNQYTVSLYGGVATVMDWGYFPTYVFQDDSGAVTVSNDFGEDAQVFQNPGLPSTGVTRPGVTTVGDAVNPQVVELRPAVAEQLLRVGFDRDSGELASQNRSSIFGFTSYLPPKFSIAAAQDGGIANGYVPAPIPEPSVAVMGIGCLLAGAVIGLRRRRKA
jgi:hypothetical protein